MPCASSSTRWLARTKSARASMSPRASASRRKISWASAGSCRSNVTARRSTRFRPNRLTCSQATTQPRFLDQCASRQLDFSRCAACCSIQAGSMRAHIIAHTLPPTSRICAAKIQFGGSFASAEPGNTWNLRSRVPWKMPRSSLRPTWVGRPAKRLRWIVSKRSAASFSTIPRSSRSPPLPFGERVGERGGCSRERSCEARLLLPGLRKPGPSPRPSPRRGKGDAMWPPRGGEEASSFHPSSCTTSSNCRCSSRHSRMRMKLRKCREHQSRSFDCVSSPCAWSYPRHRFSTPTKSDFGSAKAACAASACWRASAGRSRGSWMLRKATMAMSSRSACSFSASTSMRASCTSIGSLASVRPMAVSARASSMAPISARRR